MLQSTKTLPSLASVVKKYGLSADKSLGQNFLLDINITDKIARQAGNLAGESVIEIGPGPGGLTRAILEQGAKSVTVIERDERCLPILEEIANAYPNRLNIIMGDALKVNFQEIAANCPTKPKIIANLPYNVGTMLLINWLLPATWPPFYKDMTLMFQKEVAERIVAEPNTAAYGRLAVLSRWRTNSRICFSLPPEAFSPPPKVNSAVVHLIPIQEPEKVDSKALDHIVRLAFGQKRKMLRQSLKSINEGNLLSSLDIDEKRRAETLTVDEFIKIANAIEA